MKKKTFKQKIKYKQIIHNKSKKKHKKNLELYLRIKICQKIYIKRKMNVFIKTRLKATKIKKKLK